MLSRIWHYIRYRMEGVEFVNRVLSTTETETYFVLAILYLSNVSLFLILAIFLWDLVRAVWLLDRMLEMWEVY